jgi:hypothetical protein
MMALLGSDVAMSISRRRATLNTVGSKDVPTTIRPINENGQGSTGIGVSASLQRWCGLLFAITVEIT